MKTCGIIAEYNPFHQGHRYHLSKAKEASGCEALVVITSGLFSQRGLPSLMDPAAKARLALENGADLVLELPACYTLQSARYFSRYAIQSLSALGIDSLCFGSETNDIPYLESLSLQKKDLKTDPSTSLNHNTDLNLQPNDILAYHYIQDCRTHHIEPICVQREDRFKSATKTRHDFFAGQPQDFDSFFHPQQKWDNYYPYLRTFLMMSDPKRICEYFLVNEGIEYRLKQVAAQASCWRDFLEGCITKTYSRSRIQRTCLMILLQITKEQMREFDSFFQVKALGFNEKGQRLLKQCDAPVYTKRKELPAFLKDVDIKSYDLYNSVLTQPIKRQGVIRYE